MKWQMEAETALRAVTSCAETFEDKARSISSIKNKGSHRDLVTELDTMIEKSIFEFLSATPHRIIGEESAVSDEIYEDETVWCVDPLDGTTNLVSGIPLYAISVGLIHSRRFVLGAVAIPPQKELFFNLGCNAYLNDKGLKVVPSDMPESLVAVTFSSRAHDENRRRKEYALFGRVNDASRGCLRTGSAAVNICYAAVGRFQAAYGIASRSWDVAGGLAISAAAGCRVLVEWIDDGHLINYVVGAPGVADELAAMIGEEGLANLSSTYCQVEDE